MEQQDNTPAEKEEKPDFELDKMTKQRDFLKRAGENLVQQNQELQQEITTLRARIAELETAKSGQKQG